MKRIILMFFIVCVSVFAGIEDFKLDVTGYIGMEVARDHPFQSDGFNNDDYMTYAGFRFSDDVDVMIGYAINSFGNKIEYYAITKDVGDIYFFGVAYIKGYNKQETITDSEGNTYLINVAGTNEDQETVAPVGGVRHKVSDKCTIKLTIVGTAISMTVDVGIF